jgi:hypothetical protein
MEASLCSYTTSDHHTQQLTPAVPYLVTSVAPATSGLQVVTKTAKRHGDGLSDDPTRYRR